MWDNKPASCGDINSLIVSLKSKNVDIKHYIGDFGFDWSDNAYYLTPERKLMRVKTTWESATNGGGLLMMKIHWSETHEI